MRLHIIGIPSAGKTTLSTSMSSLLGASHHDLDGLAFVDDQWTWRSVPDRDAMVARILEEPSFVSEGGFLGWTEPLFAAAHHIIWLDPPLRVLIWRHVRRHGRHPRWLPTHLWFQVRMYRRPEGAGPMKSDPNQTRAGIESALKPWAHKVVRVTRPVTAEDILKLLGSFPSAP
jgi:hypothetical protein